MALNESLLMIEMECKVMFLMYEDIKLVEFTEVVDNEYIASGFFKENDQFKKYKEKLKMDDGCISVLKDSKKYNIIIEEIYNNEIEFIWESENPFLINTSDYIKNTKYNKNIDFKEVDKKLKFHLNEDIKEFYRKTNFSKICGYIKANQIEKTKKWGTWFEEDVNITLFGMEYGETIESFFKSKCYDWTGGYDFGNRILIGDLEDNRGNMLVVFNNDNGNVEWIDSEYGCFGNLEEDPNGILASSIDELIKILDNNTIGDQYE